MSNSHGITTLRKFKQARTEFIKFFEAHSNSTRQDFIRGLGWVPEKVDIFLKLLIEMGLAIPVRGPDGMERYQFEDFFVAVRRKLAKQAPRLEAPSPEAEEPPIDYVELLWKKGLL